MRVASPRRRRWSAPRKYRSEESLARRVGGRLQLALQSIGQGTVDLEGVASIAADFVQVHQSATSRFPQRIKPQNRLHPPDGAGVVPLGCTKLCELLERAEVFRPKALTLGEHKIFVSRRKQIAAIACSNDRRTEIVSPRASATEAAPMKV